MYPLIKWFLFRFDPERIHYFTFSALRKTLKVPGVRALWKKRFTINDKRLETTVAGVTFPNPVGLAAGFDKNAVMINDLADCGFGSIEIGTVTPVGQEGNPKPRLFRLPQDEAVINRMGFNNDGVEIIAERLKNLRKRCIVGGNIGKNKITPNEEATSDYLKSYNVLEPYVDYFVVNVSSPNTPNLRELQDKGPLLELLGTLMERKRLIGSVKPVFLKIAPDLTDEQLDDIIEIVKTSGIAGVIATNTTIDRSGLSATKERIEEIGAGGVSGQPVRKRSTEVIRYLTEKSGNAFPVIGVGGIHSAEDALEKLAAGAVMIQLYTGFIYEGPALVKRINKAILAKRIAEANGK